MDKKTEKIGLLSLLCKILMKKINY